MEPTVDPQAPEEEPTVPQDNDPVQVQISTTTRDLLKELREQTGRPNDAVIRRALLKLKASEQERHLKNEEWATS